MISERKIWSLFYLATLLFGCAEGFFLTLSLYINHLGGNEKLTGLIFSFQAIGAISLIPFGGIIIRYIKVVHLIIAGIAMFTVGAAIFWLSPLNLPVYLLAGILVGAGWGIVYTIAPVTVTTISEPRNHVVHFGILAACNMLGMGISPVITWFLQQQQQLNHMFFISFLLAIISGVLFFILSRYPQTSSVFEIAARPHFTSLVLEEIGHWKRVLLSHSRYPIMMVFLGACVFSSMANFQATFAEANRLNYSLYYVVYTATVIIARIFLSPYLNRFNLYTMGNIMLGIMCLGLLAFIFVASSPILYVIATILLGFGYGLAYPIIKAQSIEHLKETRKESTLICFSLSYFLGLYIFPLCTGFLIVDFGYKVLLVVLLFLGLSELSIGIYSQSRKICKQSRSAEIQL